MTQVQTAFGLDLRCDEQLAFLQGAVAKPTGRSVDLVREGGDLEQLHWPHSAELVCDERERDGTINFQIRFDQDAGYLMWGPRYGGQILSTDGKTLRYMPEAHEEHTWQRFMIAQALPFAALLNGLEIFHAGAVVRESEAIALLGPSRSGKTSIALELCRRGASFLADDVLAVESFDGELLGHPGAPVAGVDHAESERVAARHGATPGTDVTVTERERIVALQTASEPAPLGALFFLDRRTDGEAPSFEPLTDAQQLLAATFNSVLATPERLRQLLDVCASAARLRVERVIAGPTVDATELAGAIERRLAG